MESICNLLLSRSTFNLLENIVAVVGSREAAYAKLSCVSGAHINACWSSLILPCVPFERRWRLDRQTKSDMSPSMSPASLFSSFYVQRCFFFSLSRFINLKTRYA